MEKDVNSLMVTDIKECFLKVVDMVWGDWLMRMGIFMMVTLCRDFLKGKGCS